MNPLTRLAVRAAEADADDGAARPKARAYAPHRMAGLEPLASYYTLFFPWLETMLGHLERHLAALPAGAQYIAAARASRSAVRSGSVTEVNSMATRGWRIPSLILESALWYHAESSSGASARRPLESGSSRPRRRPPSSGAGADESPHPWRFSTVAALRSSEPTGRTTRPSASSISTRRIADDGGVCVSLRQSATSPVSEIRRC